MDESSGCYAFDVSDGTLELEAGEFNPQFLGERKLGPNCSSDQKIQRYFCCIYKYMTYIYIYIMYSYTYRTQMRPGGDFEVAKVEK